MSNQAKFPKYSNYLQKIWNIYMLNKPLENDNTKKESLCEQGEIVISSYRFGRIITQRKYPSKIFQSVLQYNLTFIH